MEKRKKPKKKIEVILRWNVDWTTRAALKVMPPILLCWPMTSEVEAGTTAVEVESSCQYSVTFWCYVTDGSRGTVWQNVIWHEVCMKKRCGIEFLCEEETASTGIHQRLLNMDGDQEGDISTARWWLNFHKWTYLLKNEDSKWDFRNSNKKHCPL